MNNYLVTEVVSIFLKRGWVKFLTMSFWKAIILSKKKKKWDNPYLVFLLTTILRPNSGVNMWSY